MDIIKEIKSVIWVWRSYCPNAQDKIINNIYWLGGLAGIWLTDKNMLMSGPVYMHTSIVTPGLAVNPHIGNGRNHRCIVERPDMYIIFLSSCSSQISLWHIIQHVNYTQTLDKSVCISLYATGKGMNPSLFLLPMGK